MRVLVCGGRDFYGVALLNRTLDDLHAAQPFTVLIHGTARGADLLGDAWAKQNKIEIERYRPDWSKYGNGAGHIRNKRMLDDGKPDLVVAFKGGKGTANMVKQARVTGVPVLEIA